MDNDKRINYKCDHLWQVLEMKRKGNLVFLDDLDRSILKILGDNAKEKYTEIGRRLNYAHSTIYDRIKKMEEGGIIAKYTVIVNPDKTGAKFLSAIVTVYANPKECLHIAEELIKKKNVSQVFTAISEELVTIAKVVAKDQEELHAFIARFIAPLPGVLRIRTSIITQTHKDEKNLSI